MAEIAPPTHAEILRLVSDPEFRQYAIDRWGIDALMDPACENCASSGPTTPCASCGKSIGLGDLIKRVTRLFGVKPCSACEQRAAKLNRWRLPMRRR